MRKPVPPIRESADDLKQRFKQERHAAKQQRLRTLYLLASGQAHYPQDVATLLGVDRNTVGRGLTLYESGGLESLLDVYIPPGKRPPLSPAQLSVLQQRLRHPDGLASYGAVRQWIAATFGVQLSYNAVHKLVRYKLRAKLKVARPSPIKKRRRHHRL